MWQTLSLGGLRCIKAVHPSCAAARRPDASSSPPSPPLGPGPFLVRTHALFGVTAILSYGFRLGHCHVAAASPHLIRGPRRPFYNVPGETRITGGSVSSMCWG